MTMRSVQKLLRSSQIPTDSSSIAAPAVLPSLFPLVANSPAMQTFLRNILNLARSNMFVAISGNKGDFLEAGDIFAKCTEDLGLKNPSFVRPDQIRETLREIHIQRTGALCFTAGAQIPPGIQEALASAQMPSYTGLVLTLVHLHKNLSARNLLRPNFFVRCGGMSLTWPEWQDRPEDHADLIDFARKVIERSHGTTIKLSTEALYALRSTQWKSVGHMVRAMNNVYGKPLSNQRALRSSQLAHEATI